ncbi:MAG TPA: hypothetical protein PK452_11820 [Amaricoccus sp.]|uniref:hypothetical protein n=1 Tax=Amaricoccus sp. TaxID=1872485 RepID=UPI002B7ED7EC|nr:hypothetical protein [Amaricoccus sp.]HRO12210.1 hypothetical protein [Amaricoccus sp.]
MPRRKTDATKDDVAAPETPDASEEIRPGAEAASQPETGALPPAGAESEPAPQPAATESAEAVATVTVDEAAAGDPAAAAAEPSAPEAAERAPEPAPEQAAEQAAERAAEPVAVEEREADHHEDHGEEEGWSLPARVLTALVLLLAGAGLGIWAAPKIAPVLPAGMKPVADWLTPGAGMAETEIAALRGQLDQGLSGVETRLAALPTPDDLDQRIASAVDGARGELAGEIDALRQAVGQIDPTAARQRLDRLDAGLKGQEAELSALKEQLAGAAAASGQLSDEAIKNLNVYNAEMQGLRAETGALQDRVSALATRIDEVAANAEREIATAQTRVGDMPRRSRCTGGPRSSRRRPPRSAPPRRAPRWRWCARRWRAASPSPTRSARSRAGRASAFPPG